MKVRILTAAVGVAGLIFLAAACDQATTQGNVWRITPDVALHRSLNETILVGTGQCGNATATWIARSRQYNVDLMNQGDPIIVSCYPGYPTGTWGLETSHS